MKIAKSLFFFAAAAFASVSEVYPRHCYDIIEKDGIIYEDWFFLYDSFFGETFGGRPPGLSLKATIQDSSLYVVGADICFLPNGDDRFPKNKPIEVPLRAIFPELKSDTVWLSSATGLGMLVEMPAELGRSFAYLLIQDGRLYRFYKDGSFLDKDYSRFEEMLLEKDNARIPSDSNERHKDLMKRLKPYYGKELWKLVE